MKKLILLALATIILIPIMAQCADCQKNSQTMTMSQESSKAPVLKVKLAHWIDSNHYVTYRWNKAPKIGTYILLVNVFNKDKKMVKDLTVTANSYMPSMRGAHDTGFKALKLNKKSQYAIGVNFMMLGAWEIELKFAKDAKTLGTALVKQEIK